MRPLNHSDPGSDEEVTRTLMRDEVTRMIHRAEHLDSTVMRQQRRMATVIIRNRLTARPTPVWAAALTASGVLAGFLLGMALRSEPVSSVAAPVDQPQAIDSPAGEPAIAPIRTFP